MVLNATFNNISVMSWWSVLLMVETWEYHRPVTSHWQALSHNVVSSTPHLSKIRTHIFTVDRDWLQKSSFCVLCAMLPVSLDCPFLILRFSPTFIHNEERGSSRHYSERVFYMEQGIIIISQHLISFLVLWTSYCYTILCYDIFDFMLNWFYVVDTVCALCIVPSNL